MEIKNKKATFDYTILKELEAGIELKGTEIKSIRKGSCDLKDSFVIIKNKEAYVLNMYVAKYDQASQFNHDERRTRKLLLHKEEIKRLKEEKESEGISIIPLNTPTSISTATSTSTLPSSQPPTVRVQVRCSR